MAIAYHTHTFSIPTADAADLLAGTEGGKVITPEVLGPVTAAGKALLSAANAGAQRAALDLEPGTDVQAYDADLTAIGALEKTDGNFIVGDGSAWVAESGATARASLGLIIGTDVQAYSENLAEYAAVNPTSLGLSLLAQETLSSLKSVAGVPYLHSKADFGLVADGRSETTTVTISSGSASLSVSPGVFTSSDVGKSICIPGAGTGGAIHFTRITGYSGAGSVTLQDNAVTTVGGVSKTLRMWTDQTAALASAVAASLGRTLFLAPSTYEYGFDGRIDGTGSYVDPLTGQLAIIGEPGTVLRYYEGVASSQRYLFRSNNSADKGDLLFRDLTFKGTLDLHGRRAGNPLYLDHYRNVRLKDCNFEFIAGEAMAFHFCSAFFAEGNSFEDIAADQIRVRDTPNCIVVGNRMLRGGDDAIAIHDNILPPTRAPIREGVIIANNSAINSKRIAVYGGKSVIIHGNYLKLLKTWPIAVEFQNSSEGRHNEVSISITNNTVIDCLSTLGGSYINVSASPARGSSATNSTKPLRYDSTSGTIIRPWDWYEHDYSVSTDAMPPATGIVIKGNICQRTLPAGVAFSDYGYGEQVEQGVYSDPTMTDADLRPNGGISLATKLNAEFSDVLIEGNVVKHVVYYGIYLPGSTSDNLNTIGNAIRGNRVADVGQQCIRLASGSYTADVVIENNDLDGDPFRTNSNSNLNGTYDASGDVSGIGLASGSGAIVRNNKFRNVCTPVSATGVNVVEGNTLFLGTPSALGFNTGNTGVGNVPNNQEQYSYVLIDADPTSATYGQVNSTTVEAASAMPSSGWYPIGWQVKNSNPSTSARVKGWIRITTGTGHSLGSDWLEMRGACASGSKSYDPPSIASGATATTTLTVTGGLMGDTCIPSFSLDLQGLQMTAYISTDGTATVVLSNLTGGAIDLASGTLNVVAFKA